MYFNKDACPQPQSDTLIKKVTPAQVFSCEFCKNLRIPFFIEQHHASVILTLLKYDFQFIADFSRTFVTFQRVT